MEVGGMRAGGNLEGMRGEEQAGQGLREFTGKKRGVRGRGAERRWHGNGRSWELPCWRFPYCQRVCHGISQPNKEEFK